MRLAVRVMLFGAVGLVCAAPLAMVFRSGDESWLRAATECGGLGYAVGLICAVVTHDEEEL